MLVLKLGKSKQATGLAIAQHNGAQSSLSDKLRTSHRSMLGKLIYYYQQQLATLQSYGQWGLQSKSLPALRTNNKQLAGALGCSERTIINLRSRLRQAKFIAEQWHGSNASFEVWLNPDLLYIQQGGHPENLAPKFASPLQSLRHTVSSTYQDTSKLNELSGAVSSQTPDNEPVMHLAPVENPGFAVENANGDAPAAGFGQVTPQDTHSGYKPGKSIPASPANSLRDTTSKKFRKKGSAQLPAALPASLSAIYACLEHPYRNRLDRHVMLMWSAAKRKLYGDGYYLDERQERMGKIALAEYLAYSAPRLWKAGAQQVLDRIDLVEGWIERRHKAGKKGFVPIPEVYFDFRNPKGFVATKAWYKTHRRNLNEIHDRVQLTKARKEYLRSLEDGARIGPNEALRTLLQRLGKRSPELAERFKEDLLSITSSAAA